METFILEVQPPDSDNFTTDVLESFKEENESVDICRLCLNLSKLQPIEDIKISKFGNNFDFLESKLKFTLPDDVCANCWQKLNEILLFTKQCKESHLIYSRMQKNCSDPSVIQAGDGLSGHKNQESGEPDTKKTRKPGLLLKHESKICYKCGEEISTTYTEHYKLSPNCRPKNYECPKCSKSFKSGHDLGIHEKSQHDGAAFMCHVCSKTMRNPLSLRRHLREHKLGKMHICEICAKGFSRLTALNEHRNLHAKVRPIYGCKACGKKFTARSNLSAHLKLHANETDRKDDNTADDLTCKLCKRSFSLLRSLKLHMKIHSENRRYVCKICHICFDDARLHKEHISVSHMKERQFRCLECSKRFTTRESLHTHSLTHQDPSFLCSSCGKQFRLQSHLKRHLSLIHNVNKGEPFRCNFCSKSFNVKGNLTAHERIHTGEKPYACHVCNMSFVASNARKKHIMRVHGGSEAEKQRH